MGRSIKLIFPATVSAVNSCLLLAVGLSFAHCASEAKHPIEAKKAEATEQPTVYPVATAIPEQSTGAVVDPNLENLYADPVVDPYAVVPGDGTIGTTIPVLQPSVPPLATSATALTSLFASGGGLGGIASGTGFNPTALLTAATALGGATGTSGVNFGALIAPLIQSLATGAGGGGFEEDGAEEEE